MEIDNKILVRDGIVEFVDNKYMCFRVYDHITKPRKETIYEIVEAYEKLNKGKKTPLLLVANSIDRVEKEEHQIIRETTKRFFTAQAIVTKSKFTIMVVNLLSSFSTPPVPTKLFSTEEKALEWLEDYY